MITMLISTIKQLLGVFMFSLPWQTKWKGEINEASGEDEGEHLL